MKYYELKILAEPGLGAGDFDDRVKDAAAFVSGSVKVYHTTIHGRPSSDSPDNHDAAVLVGVEDKNEVYELAGVLARKHGNPMVNFLPLGQTDNTLDLKADEDAEEDALKDAFDASDHFRIRDIEDRADE